MIPLWNLVQGKLRGKASMASQTKPTSLCMEPSSSSFSRLTNILHIALNVIWSKSVSKTTVPRCSHPPRASTTSSSKCLTIRAVDLLENKLIKRLRRIL
uniref:Cytochrome P450 family protein n=1 Tax=Arabidopsis thaliana TaxID=3702 RepID=Q1PFU9_ARATH|nr:cytochrome P450 family protein [Arabidopsis thaliana]